MIGRLSAQFTIRTFFPVACGVLLASLLALGALLWALSAAHAADEQARRDRAAVIVAADEVRDASDALALHARLYVESGDGEHVRRWRRALNIRDGSARRPPEMDWRQLPGDKPPKGESGDPESLNARIEAAVSPGAMRDLLRQALASSEGMTQFEMSVFSDLSSDEKDMEAARKALFSPRYQSMRSDMLDALRELRTELRREADAAGAFLQRRRSLIYVAAALVVAAGIASLAAMLLFSRRRLLRPMQDLTRSMRSVQLGASADRRAASRGAGRDEIGMLTRQFFAIKQQMDESYDTLKKASFTDSLTGLYNRQYFFQTGINHFRVAARDRQPLCILICDIDHFKLVNDRHGHLAGDKALKHAASTIAKGVRETDICARFGGEEFLALLLNATAENAAVRAEEIRSAVEASPCGDGADAVAVTVSIGVAEAREGESLNDAIDRADRALYQAKNDGRNCVRVSS